MTSTTRPSLVATLTASFLLVLASPAHADGSTAQELFREGRALLDAGSYEQACAKFAESQRLEPAAGTLLNLAECEEKRGLIATAATTYKEAAIAAALRNRKDWERHALDRLEALAPMIPILTISLAPGARASGVALTLDDHPIRTEDGAMPRAVDPGSHTVVATAPGHKPWTQTASLAKGARVTMAVPLLEDDRPRAASTQQVRVEEKSSWARPTGIAVGAVGVAGVAFGAIAGVLTLDARADAVRGCTSYPDVCTMAGTKDNDRAQTWATMSTVGLGAGLVLVAAGAFLAFVVPSF